MAKRIKKVVKRVKSKVEEIVWEEPPNNSTTRVNSVANKLSPLKDRPKEWARIGVYVNSQRAGGAAQSMKRSIKAAKIGKFEFKSGKVDLNGTEYGVWARFLRD
jgi:hypothetical protein